MKLSLNKHDWLFFAIIIALGIMQAFSYRYTTYSADDCSYLDQASFFQRFDFAHGITSYWSPLYPAIVGLIFRIFNPPLAEQLFAIKLVNVGILAVLVLSFLVFLKQFTAQYDTRISEAIQQARLSNKQIHVLGYILFGWAFLAIGGVQQATPDQLVAAFLFLAVALVLKLAERPTLGKFALLGFILGLGYLAKAVMIPAAVILIAIAVFNKHSDNGHASNRMTGGLLAVVTMALTASPYVIALSADRGNFNIGSSAGLNYMMTVNPRYQYLKYDDEIAAELVHPVKWLSKNPTIIEFDRGLDVTFAPWYDPSYFAEGLRVRFDVIASTFTLIVNALFVFYVFGWQLLVTYLVSASAARLVYLPCRRQCIDFAALWLPAGITVLSLCLVINLPTGMTTPRYFAPFIVLIYLTFFAVMKFADNPQGKTAIKIATATTCSIAALLLLQSLFKDIRHLVSAPPDRVGQVTKELKKLGITSGDRAATIGLEDFEWARRMGVRVVAEMTTDGSSAKQDASPDDGQGSDKPALDDIIAKLKPAKAKFVIYFVEPVSEHQINEINYVKGLRSILARAAGKQSNDDVASPRFSPQALSDWTRLDGLDVYVRFF
jgi:hypothetical protein